MSRWPRRGALLPIYVERDLGMSPAFTSLLVSLETVMGGLISVTAGALADRLGHRLVLVIGILGFSAGLLQFLTGVPWLLVALGRDPGTGARHALDLRSELPADSLQSPVGRRGHGRLLSRRDDRDVRQFRRGRAGGRALRVRRLRPGGAGD